MMKEVYIGADLHERETQLAVFNREGNIVDEKRVKTEDIYRYISSIKGEKHVAVESVGFIYPIYVVSIPCICS